MTARFFLTVVALLAVVVQSASDTALQSSNLRPRVTVTLGDAEELQPHLRHHRRPHVAALRSRNRARAANQATTVVAASGNQVEQTTQVRGAVAQEAQQTAAQEQAKQTANANDIKQASARAASQLAAAARRASVLNAAAHAKDPVVSNQEVAPATVLDRPDVEVAAPTNLVAGAAIVHATPPELMPPAQPEDETVNVVHQMRQEIAEVHQHQTNVIQLESALSADKALLHESNLLLTMTQSRIAREKAAKQVAWSQQLVRSTEDMLADSRLAAAEDAQSAVREVDTIAAATEDLRKAAMEELAKYGQAAASLSTTAASSSVKKDTAVKPSQPTLVPVIGQTIEDEN